MATLIYIILYLTIAYLILAIVAQTYILYKARKQKKLLKEIIGKLLEKTLEELEPYKDL